MNHTRNKSIIFLTLLIFLISMGMTLGISEKFQLKNPTTTLISSTLLADPELIGPNKLCNIYGSVIGDFFGAGDPLTDIYSWKIYNPSNQLIFDRSGGAGFQTISFTFSAIGTHRIELEVERGASTIYSQSQDVELIKGPITSLLPNYNLCGTNPLSLTALDPASPNFMDYKFIWKDNFNQTIGSNNIQTVDKPGTYSVTFYFEDSQGRSCETTISTLVSLFDDYKIEGTSSYVCPDNTVILSTSPVLNGTWYYQKNNDPTEILLGRGNDILITPILDLDQPGNYSIIFEPDIISGNSCLSKKSFSLPYYPQPDYEIIDTQGSSECFVPDGTITVRALTPLDKLFIEEFGVSAPPLNVGDTFQFTGLKSGAYTLTGQLGECLNFLGAVVTLKTPPENLDFEIQSITGEVCTEDAKLNGLIDIIFPNGPLNGWYRVINEKGTLIRNAEISGETNLSIDIPGGLYYFELYGQDSCRIPKAELINVPGLEQTDFYVPDTLTICQSFELFPESNQILDYTLIFPGGSTETRSTGEPFILREAGPYKIIGFLPNQSNVCPSNLQFVVKLVDPVEFEPKLIKQDCFGNRTYFADINGRDPSTVFFSWYNENDELIGTGQNMFPTSIGEFKLDVQPANSAACPIPPKTFLIEEPILEVDVTLTSTKLCELGPGATLNLESTFPDEITDIKWRRYDASGAIENLDQFKDLKEITVFDDGVYEASVFSIIPEIGKDCELGRNSFELTFNLDRVDFTIPDSLSICETFDIIPETSQPLLFELTRPDGSLVKKNAGEAFTLDQNGMYSLYGYNPEVSSPNCPEIKEFYVQVNQPIPFEPVLFSEDCLGGKIYQAKLTGANPEDALFFWYNENKNLISTEEFLILNGTFGIYYLEVQPKNSVPCDLEPIEFEVSEPVLSVEVNLLTAPLCPDAPNTLLSMETDLEKVSTIEWWFTDLNGNQSELVSQKNKTEILAINEGTYEVRVFNDIPCLLGSDLALVTRSIDQMRPEVKESYQICPRYEIAPTINPGSFSVYEWYYEGALVSTSSTFKPLLVGNFELIVFSAEGCPYSARFETVEECELKVTYPNAIELENPDKGFLVYTNYLIDELEVYIFNKWGQVVFQCIQTNLITEESTCSWDGTFQGKFIPNGSYAVRLNYKNLEKGINEFQIGSILVIK